MDDGWEGEEPRVMGTSSVVVMTTLARGSHRARHMRITGSMLRSRFLDPVLKDFGYVDLEGIEDY